MQLFINDANGSEFVLSARKCSRSGSLFYFHCFVQSLSGNRPHQILVSSQVVFGWIVDQVSFRLRHLRPQILQRSSFRSARGQHFRQQIEEAVFLCSRRFACACARGAGRSPFEGSGLNAYFHWFEDRQNCSNAVELFCFWMDTPAAEFGLCRWKMRI